MLRELAPCGQRRPERGNTHPCRFYHLAEFCTGRMGLMAHRKLKEIKQQPGKSGPGNMLGCCLLSFYFLWAINPIRPVVGAPHLEVQWALNRAKSPKIFEQMESYEIPHSPLSFGAFM